MKLFDYFKTNRELERRLHEAEKNLKAKEVENEKLRIDLGYEIQHVSKLQEENHVLNYNLNFHRRAEKNIEIATDICKACGGARPQDVIDIARRIEQYFIEKEKEAV